MKFNDSCNEKHALTEESNIIIFITSLNSPDNETWFKSWSRWIELNKSIGKGNSNEI